MTVINATGLPLERIELMVKLAPSHLRAVALAVRDAGAMMILMAQTKERVRVPEGRTGPVIAIVGDDLHVSKGPRGFSEKSLHHLLDQAAHVSIVSCEPLPEAYAIGAGAAVGAVALGLPHRLALIVETRPEHEREWIKFVRRLRPDVQLLVATTKPEEVNTEC